MIDPQFSATTPITVQIDPVELDPCLDFGEAGQKNVEDSSEAKPELSNDQVVRNFELAKRVRAKLVELRLISAEYAENLELPGIADARPHPAHQIEERWAELQQQLNSHDETAPETKELLSEQAGLALEYAYNTTALLHKCYYQELGQQVAKLRQQYSANQTSGSTDYSQLIEVARQAQQQLGALNGLGTELESFNSSVQQVVPELLTKYPELTSSAYFLNQAVRVEVGMNLLEAPDQKEPQDRDLIIILDKLMNNLRLEKLDYLQSQFQKLIDSLSQSSVTARTAQPEDIEVKPVGQLNTGSELPKHLDDSPSGQTMDQYISDLTGEKLTDTSSDPDQVTLQKPPTLDELLANLDVSGGKLGPSKNSPSIAPTNTPTQPDNNFEAVLAGVKNSNKAG